MISANNVSRQLLRTKLIEKFGSYRRTHDEMRVNCPFCLKNVGKVDTDKHLYINVGKNKFNCFRCPARGYASTLVSGLMYDFSMPSENKYTSPVISSTDIEMLPDNIEDVDDLPLDHPAINYLYSRVDPLDVEHLPIYYCDNYVRNEKEYGARLFFPIFYKNIYYGFQARSLKEDDDLRYVGSYNLQKNAMMFNWEEAEKHDILIITEGIFDCIMCGERAVCVFGKSLSKKQYSLIIEKNFNKIICFLDKDAMSESKALAKKFAQNVPASYYVNYHTKDPGKLTKKEIDYLINNDTIIPDEGIIRVF